LIMRKRTRLGKIGIAGWRRQQLISQQHREIFVNGVVTVIDVGTAELPESNLKLDATIRPQAPDILSDQQFSRPIAPPRSWSRLPRSEGVSIPAAAAIDERPCSTFSRLGNRSETGWRSAYGPTAHLTVQGMPDITAPGIH
jgi:hypothetical protein